MSCQIFRSEFQSKIGKLIILHCEEGLHEVRFCSVESQQSAIQSSEECNSYRTDSSTNFIEWLDLYFNNANDVIHKTLPSICPNVLHSRGEFTTRVWRALIHHVPPGKTISYGHLASLCGNKKASCAVGTAMRVNPIPIFIPCHRVVKSDGKVGQYSGGSGMKEWLLEHEKALDVKFNKSYEISEEGSRRLIWQANIARIIRHNLEADLGLHSYRQKVNKFSDLFPDELDKYRKCAITKSNNSSTTFLPWAKSCDKKCAKTLPSQVDWRMKGYVTPVKDQGDCGSCWAFSATGALEALTAKAGKLISLSEQNLVDCSFKQGNRGCNGGWMEYGFQYVIDTKGIDSEESYKYTGRKGKCKFSKENVGTSCSFYKQVKMGSEKSLQYAVATVGPISVAIDAGSENFLFYDSGIYYDPECSSSSLNHAVLVVGYGSANGSDYWIVKNSWGEGWGIKGYILMARNKNNQCGIASHAVFPMK